MADEPAVPVFDVAAFERRTGGDAALRHEVVGMFLEDCPARLAAVHAAVEQRNAPALVVRLDAAIAELIPELRKHYS